VSVKEKTKLSDAVIIAIIGAVVSILSLYMTLTIKSKVNEVHEQINSRMDELLKINKEASEAKGNLEGRAEQVTEDSLLKIK